MNAPILPAQIEVRPGRLWSLWEMYNFRLSGLQTITGELHSIIHFACANGEAVARLPQGHKNSGLRHDEIYQRSIAEGKEWANRIAEMAKNGLGYLVCPHIDHAAESLGWWSKSDNPSYEDLRWKAINLRDAIDTELKQYYYYQYPKSKAAVVNSLTEDWKVALAAFPSVTLEAARAADCYALGHNVASVFHSMRVLEVGLRALAADVGLTFDLQQWQNIIDQIESRIRDEQKSLSRGAPRNERLQFLSEAAKEFFYFKDGWRNHVTHGRGEYDEHQALGVLTHVRSFMNHLASRLSEVP